MINLERYLLGQSVTEVRDRIHNKDVLQRLPFFAMLIVISFVMSIGSFIIRSMDPSISKVLFFIFVIAFYTVLLYISYIIWCIVSKDNDGSKKVTISNILIFLSAIIIYFLFHIFLSMMTTSATSATSVSSTSPNYSIVDMMTLIFFIGIASPIIEELALRGIFLSLYFREPRFLMYFLSNKIKINPFILNVCIGILVSATLSTAYHTLTSSSIPIDYFFNGIVAGILYKTTRHVGYPIAYHMMNNLIYLMILFLK